MCKKEEGLVWDDNQGEEEGQEVLGQIHESHVQTYPKRYVGDYLEWEE